MGKSSQMDPQNGTNVIEDFLDPTAIDPDYFSDNDYGLLNAALFVQQNPGFVWNSSDGDVQGLNSIEFQCNFH